MLQPTAKELIHIIDRRKRERHILSIQPGVPPANCDEQEQMRKDFYDAPVDLRSQPGPTTKADLQDAREYAATPEGQAETLLSRRYEKSGLVRDALLEVIPSLKYEDLDELENATWTRAVSRLDKFDENKSSFDTWLVNVARSAAKNRLRDVARLKRAQLVSEGTFRSDENDDRPYYEALIGRSKAGEEFKDVNDSAEECAAEEMMEEDMQAFLSSLPNSERQVAYMTYVQGATRQEVAATLGVQPNTVDGLMGRVRIKLRASACLQLL